VSGFVRVEVMVLLLLLLLVVLVVVVALVVVGTITGLSVVFGYSVVS
jgi:hypothetical protein